MGSLFGLDGNGKLQPKKQKGWKRNAEDDWIISENVHEPLVTPETWDCGPASRRQAAGRRRQGPARPSARCCRA